MTGNKYLHIPTAAGHTLEFDDSGALSIDGASVAQPNTGSVQVAVWDYFPDAQVGDDQFTLRLSPPTSEVVGTPMVQRDPVSMERMIPLQTLLAGHYYRLILLSQDLNSAPGDGIDLYGRITAWDVTGANLLCASFSPFIDHSFSTGRDSVFGISKIAQAGSIHIDGDTSGANFIVDADGVYNLQISARAVWD